MLKVIGLGNALRGDDAIGPFMITELEKLEPELPVKLIDAGADAFTILEHLIGQEPILIIDCAQMGTQAGTVKRFDVKKANIGHLSKTVSLHGFGFGDVYKMAREMGRIVPCTIVGVEPKEVAFDIGLSDEVKASIPQIIKLVNEEAQNYA